MDDTDADRAAVAPIVNLVDGYPLSRLDGEAKTVAWAMLPSYPGDAGDAKMRWLKPEMSLAQLPSVFESVPPLAGEMPQGGWAPPLVENLGDGH